jgi:predicted HicB family RNase H-like nuclease
MAQRVDTVTVTIRTSKELHKWLLHEAKANNRSLNREIEYKLMKLKEAKEAEEKPRK